MIRRLIKILPNSFNQVETKLKNAKVEIHAVPAKNVQDNVMRGNFDMYLSLWLADYADPMSYNQIIIKIMVDIIVPIMIDM